MKGLHGRVKRTYDTGWVPVATARRLLGVSRQRCYQLIDQGKLVSMEMDGTILVSAQSVAARRALMAKGERGHGLDW